PCGSRLPLFWRKLRQLFEQLVNQSSAKRCIARLLRQRRRQIALLAGEHARWRAPYRCKLRSRTRFDPRREFRRRDECALPQSLARGLPTQAKVFARLGLDPSSTASLEGVLDTCVPAGRLEQICFAVFVVSSPADARDVKAVLRARHADIELAQILLVLL